MQAFTLRRNQEQFLHEILDRGLDLINEDDGEVEVQTPMHMAFSPSSDLRSTERPSLETYLGASVRTERPYEEPYFKRKREQEAEKFTQKPLEPYIPHATEGLETELSEVQTRMKMLESQLQGQGRPLSDFHSPQDARVVINPPMTLQDLYDFPAVEVAASERTGKKEVKARSDEKPQVAEDFDVNDYSLPELERLKWALMEEKRIQEKVQRENTKLATRIRFRIDMEKKVAEMREMVNNLRLSVQKSQHLRKRQKGLIRVIQFQIDRKTLRDVGEKYPSYVHSLRRRGRGSHKRKHPLRSIIQHGRICASRR